MHKIYIGFTQNLHRTFPIYTKSLQKGTNILGESEPTAQIQVKYKTVLLPAKILKQRVSKN